MTRLMSYYPTADPVRREEQRLHAQNTSLDRVITTGPILKQTSPRVALRCGLDKPTDTWASSKHRKSRITLAKVWKE